jgi:hypothetical protein
MLRESTTLNVSSPPVVQTPAASEENWSQVGFPMIRDGPITCPVKRDSILIAPTLQQDGIFASAKRLALSVYRRESSLFAHVHDSTPKGNGAL